MYEHVRIVIGGIAALLTMRNRPWHGAVGFRGVGKINVQGIVIVKGSYAVGIISGANIINVIGKSFPHSYFHSHTPVPANQLFKSNSEGD
jgi:hypothetical protein